MKNFDISTDSNCDLYFDEIKALDIYVGHLHYTLDNGTDFSDNLDSFTQESQYVDFYNKLRNGYVAKTSILSLQAHIDLFTEMAKKGIKNAIHIAQSKGLSPTIDNANKAIEIVKQSFPEINYVAIESNSTTCGEGILVRVVCKMRDEGKSLSDAVNFVEQNKMKLQHIVMVDDLTCLKRGGRISGPKAMIATMLNIKPIIEFSKQGTLDVFRKEIGAKKALIGMVNEFASHTLNKDYTYCVIVHTDNKERATILQNMIVEKCGIKPEIRIMGPIIGAHVGPGAVAITYLSNEERPL